jgi:hypothetical protein
MDTQGQRVERVAHTATSLAGAFKTQLRLLLAATVQYDQGHLEQALIMATQLRVLLHDHQESGKKATSTSLLKQIGFKDQLKFLDTSVENMPSVMGGPSITIEAEHLDGTREMVPLGCDGLFGVDSTAFGYVYVAPLSRRQGPWREQPFDAWWNDLVISFPDRSRYSRWLLVRQMANVAGGAHIDPRGLEKGYANFAQEGIAMWLSDNALDAGRMGPVGSKPSGDPAAASMRQIAYEFLKTVDNSRELQDWTDNPV